jgi:hypothetical protein
MTLGQTTAFYYRCDHGDCTIRTPLIDADTTADEEWWATAEILGWRFVDGATPAEWVALCPLHAEAEVPAGPRPADLPPRLPAGKRRMLSRPPRARP